MLHSTPMGLSQCRCGSRQRLASCTPPSKAAAAAVPRPQRQHQFSPQSSPAAAAADATTQHLDGIVPYLNRNAAQLSGRHLPSDPVQGAWETAAKLALRGELLLAAAVDKRQYAPYVMAGLAGVLVGSGLDASTLLRHGLPPYMPDLLLRVFGAWDTSLWGAALTAAALPVTAWALRAWWRTNLVLLGGAAGALQQALQQNQQQSGEGSPPVSGAAAQVQQQQSQPPTTSLAHLVAAAVAVFRGVCLATAANSCIGLLYTQGASNTMMALTAATGAAALAAAVASVALLQQRHTQIAPNNSSSSSSSAAGSQTLLALFGAEAAWLAAVAGLGSLVSTAAAVVLGGSLYLLHSSVVAPALMQYRAAAGDVVEVHVGLKLAGTRPVFDSTYAEQPLRVEVGRVPEEVLQLWEAASADLGSAPESSQAEQQQQQGTGSSSSSSGGGGGGGSGGGGGDASSEAGVEPEPFLSKSLSEVQRDIQGWMEDPSARWDVLRPFVAAASDGLFLGDTVSVPLYNPKVVGFWSPHFTWWQPIGEVAEKFSGNMPGVGDVFWYPVADGAAVPTRVNAVGQDYVELDANWGVTDTELELQVQLVRLQKPQA